ncbi:MAG TPA: SEC-C metal-binding domain-containing protein [Thermoanaerobaculia bacterium]|nr:SEC-C metal-binding domain-containing protein [Thermoanaerobaculia bacterium]
MTTGRNDPCPCGSGQKYKSCCIDKQRGASRGLIYLLIAIAVVAAVGVSATLIDRRNDARSTSSLATAQTPRAATTPKPQPPGPVPAGKVWSAEHGHWHDANATPAGGVQPTRENPITMNVRNVPQPPGPVPEGKVWSTEHGHWHTKK